MDYNKVYKNYIKKSNDFTYIFDKTYLKEFENLKNKNILDIGCGEGRFAFTCSKKGAKVDAIDVSSKLIDFAKEYNYSKNINYYNLDFGNVDINKFKSKKYDFIVINMVLLNIFSEKKVTNIFEKCYKLLNKNGILAFSDLNPICKACDESYPHRVNIFPKIFSYYKKGSKYSAILKFNSEKIEFKNKHWRLQDYTNFLVKNNMYIYKIIEPSYSNTNKINSYLKNLKFPEFIIFFSKKLK